MQFGRVEFKRILRGQIPYHGSISQILSQFQTLIERLEEGASSGSTQSHYGEIPNMLTNKLKPAHLSVSAYLQALRNVNLFQKFAHNIKRGLNTT